MYSEEEGVCEAARAAGHIPEELMHLQEGVHINESGDRLGGLTVFNVPVGEERFFQQKIKGEGSAGSEDN